MANPIKYFLSVIWFLLLTSTLFSQTYRYINTVFPAAIKTSDIVYDSAPALTGLFVNESATEMEDLVMDIYTPSGDTNTNRPVIIFAHSGGFLTGDRNHDDMVAFCDSFARKGYVTATIDYRQGFNLIGNAGLHGTRAVYRGLQDGRSAVRFLRANAATYGIDPNKVYFAGSSAGAFIALHSVYMDEPSEKPFNAGPVSYNNIFFPFFHTGPDLGGFDVGGNLSFDGTPNAIISLWGALEGTELITASNNDPVFLVHGEADGTVPFTTGPPFGAGILPDVDGSDLINDQLDLLGLTDKQTYFVAGEDHEFHGASNGDWDNGIGGNAFWDIILDMSADFLFQRHRPTADFTVNSNGLMVDFLDLSTDATTWIWDFGDGNSSMVQDPMHTYAVTGDYDVFLYIENTCASWDTISLLVTVVAPLPVVWLSPLKVTYENRETTITWSVAQQVNNEKFIVEHSLDGRQFLPIATVKGDGDLVAEKTFIQNHKNPPLGLNYYRIVQVDFDGTFEYSEIVSVEVEGDEKPIAIYPNPTEGKITVEFLSGEPTEIEIYNSIGRLVKSFPAPTSMALLELSELETGLYFLKVGGVEEVQRLIVK